MSKKTLVLSGTNLVDGGALSVYRDCLNELVQNKYTKNYHIIAIVGRKSLFPDYEGVRYIEFPKSKKNWINRIYYEYVYFNKLSKQLSPDVWISLHDTTPNVKADKRYVYCHNPSPFNDMKLGEARLGWKYYLFSKFYKYLYKINIHKNTAVIVQQDWMRKRFQSMFNLNNVIVARPSMPETDKIVVENNSEEIIFVCPSYPRYYKNFEEVCEAAKLLNVEGIRNFKVYITVDGTENTYSKELVEKYKNVNSVEFCGLLERNKLFKLYSHSNSLIFVSRLETWGMPIIEYKSSGQPIIVADLPYAHETVGDYRDVAFIDVNSPYSLAEAMKKVINKQNLGNSASYPIPEPYAADWKSLFVKIL